MRITPFALPGTMGRVVERALVWTVVVATIAWSIGLSFLIKVPFAHAAVSVGSEPSSNGIPLYATLFRANTIPAVVAAFALVANAGETLDTVGYTLNSVTGVTAAEIDYIELFSNSSACTGSALFGAPSYKLCGRETSPTVGSVDTIIADADGDLGTAGDPAISPVANTPSTWLVMVTPKTSGDTLENGDKFTLRLGTQAVDTSLSSGEPTFATTFTSDIITYDTTAAADSTPPTPGAGGPPDGQVGAPPDAIVDRFFSETLVGSRVNSTNVTLKQCTGADQSATTSAGAATTACTTVGSTLCASPTLSGTGSTSKITCTPASALVPDRWHEFRIGTGVIDESGNATAAQVYRFKTGAFGGTGGSNSTMPRVVQSFPQPGATGIPPAAKISLEFPIGPEGVMKTGASTTGSVENPAHFTLRAIDATTHAPAGTDLCGATGCTLTWNATTRILLIDPTDLTSGTEYELNVADLQNDASVAVMPFFLRFTAGAADSTVPTLRTTSPTIPVNDATGVSRYTGEFTVFFSKAIDQTTATLGTNVGLYIDADDSDTRNGAESLLGAAALTLNYDPGAFAVRLGNKAALAATTKYCFQIVGGTTGVKDLSGNQFSASGSSNICFTTANDSDSTGPKVSYADADNFKLAVHFNEAMRDAGSADANSVTNPANYSLECPTGIGVNLAGKTITYRPDVKEATITGLGLTPDQSCQLLIASTLRDLAGNPFDTSGVNATAKFTVLNSTVTGGFIGTTAASTDFFGGMGGTAGTFWEKPQRCQPRASSTSKATALECEFPAPASLANGATLTLQLPDGFTYSTADGNTRAVPASQSFMNTDLNGPGPGITTITGIALDAGADTITLTLAHSGTAMTTNDMLRFELDRITTPATPLTDQRISIIVKDASAVKVGQTIQAAPFSVNTAGALAISGKVCKGSSSGGTCGDSDTGIANVKIFCDQMGGFTIGSTTSAFMGHQETTTGVGGVFSLTGLTPGQYACNIPPDPTALADVGGMSPFQQVSISAVGATTNKACGEVNRSDCVDFKYADLSATGKSLTITVSGLNDADADADDFDVFCNTNSFEFSAPVMKAIDAATAGNTTATLKLQPGKTYTCGMGPHIAFQQFQGGGPPPVPTFDFMPPRPQEVVVPLASDPTGITFAIQSTNRSITGSVVDGSANAIANVFVHAAPVGCFDASTGEQKDCFGSFAQTKTDGTFTLNVADGTYEVGADGPGLPPSTREIATVNGANVTSITLKIVKSSTTISGEVLDDSGNGIKYAHVNAEKRSITTGTDACDFANSRPSGGWADSPTDENGNYTLYASAGTWCVRAFAPAYGEVGTKTVTISGTTSQTGQNLQASAGDYGTLSGGVTKGGTAAGGGFVNCFGSAGGNHAQASSDGAYSMKLKAGTYTCDGFLPGVGPLPRSSSVAITAGATTTLSFAVGNPGTITVTIANITDAFCDARDASGFGSPAGPASSTGAYTINVPAGTYTVRCGGPKYGSLVNQAGVAVTAGGTATVTGTAPTTRAVAGRITDGTSNIAGATIKFEDSTTGKSFIKSTGSQSSTNNNLSVTGIPEGTYTVVASKKGYEPASTTATVSGGNFTLSTPLALTPASGATGVTATIPVQADSAAYTGTATVIATKTSGGTTKTVVGEMDSTTGNCSLALTNGTWTVKASGNNGKESATSTITVSSGAISGSTPTLSLANSISGYTAKNESQTLSLSAGGLTKFNDLSVGGKAPEINIPASALSTSDSSTGKVEMASNATLAGIDPGTDSNFVGTSGYDITTKDANGSEVKDLNSSVTITMPYSDADVSNAGVDESKLQFAAYDTTSQTWETFPTTVDTTNNTLTATVSHFSSFGVLGSVSTSSGGTTDTTPPAAPTTIAAAGTSSAVTLTWVDPMDSDFDSVEVLRNNPPSTAVSGIALSRVAKGTKRYVDSTVAAGTSYTYILRSRDGAGNTRNSGEVTVTTPATAAAAPTSGTVTAPPATPTTTGGGATTTVTTPTTTAPTAPGLTSIGLSAGDVVKASGTSAVYLVGADGKRYVYPNEVTYKSWNANFSGTKSLTAAQLASLPLGGVVTVRPGTWLVKIESDPKVYAVEPGGSLRWVETEARALKLFGGDWNKQIIDVPVSYWPAYRAGTALGADIHPTGSLVKSGSTTYYMDAGKKRLVDAGTFTALGFQDRFVRALSSALVYEEGPALTSATSLRFASE